MADQPPKELPKRRSLESLPTGEGTGNSSFQSLEASRSQTWCDARAQIQLPRVEETPTFRARPGLLRGLGFAQPAPGVSREQQISVLQDEETMGQPVPLCPSGVGRKRRTLAQDAYRWRKYGQKVAKGRTFPRKYYRCMHDGCPAKKTVENLGNGNIEVKYLLEEHNHGPGNLIRCGASFEAAFLKEDSDNCSERAPLVLPLTAPPSPTTSADELAEARLPRSREASECNNHFPSSHFPDLGGPGGFCESIGNGKGNIGQAGTGPLEVTSGTQGGNEMVSGSRLQVSASPSLGPLAGRHLLTGCPSSSLSADGAGQAEEFEAGTAVLLPLQRKTRRSRAAGSNRNTLSCANMQAGSEQSHPGSRTRALDTEESTLGGSKSGGGQWQLDLSRLTSSCKESVVAGVKRKETDSSSPGQGGAEASTASRQEGHWDSSKRWKPCGQTRSFRVPMGEQSPFDRGFRWKKYGGKLVKSTGYPKSYFRCTSKGCEAKKTEQPCHDDPRFYDIILIGEHTHVPPVLTTHLLSVPLPAQQQPAGPSQGGRSTFSGPSPSPSCALEGAMGQLEDLDLGSPTELVQAAVPEAATDTSGEEVTRGPSKGGDTTMEGEDNDLDSDYFRDLEDL